MAPRVVLFDIGSTLWSSPPEDLQGLLYCYGRAREALLAVLDDVPPVEALIDAVEHCFAEWEDRWRRDAGDVRQPPTTEYVADALRKLNLTPPPTRSRGSLRSCWRRACTPLESNRRSRVCAKPWRTYEASASASGAFPTRSWAPPP
jgi:hypothetical protein